MAGLNDEGQWIMIMAFIICITIFLLALVVNESILVGKTTAEGVLEFSKSDIQDLRNEILRIEEIYCSDGIPDPRDEIDSILKDMEVISLQRKHSIVNGSISVFGSSLKINIYYNDGVTQYNETIFSN